MMAKDKIVIIAESRNAPSISIEESPITVLTFSTNVDQSEGSAIASNIISLYDLDAFNTTRKKA